MNTRSKSGLPWFVECGAGTPLVMIHGAYSDYRIWEPQLESFSRYFRAISISLPGFHPRVGDDSKFSAELHVESVIKLIGQLGQPAYLLGHSR
jgi:pimeloyl-ACP methyl ester carboxylesterase